MSRLPLGLLYHGDEVLGMQAQNDLLHGIAEKLGKSPFDVSEGRHYSYLQATHRTGTDILIRVDGMELVFFTYIKGWEKFDTDRLAVLELAHPRSLTRASLRAAIKAAHRVYHERYSQTLSMHC